MQNKILNAIDYGTICLGTALGLSQIETLLGIVILCVQLVILGYKAITTIVKHIKEGNHDKAIEELERVQKELQELKDKLGEENGEVS